MEKQTLCVYPRNILALMNEGNILLWHLNRLLSLAKIKINYENVPKSTGSLIKIKTQWIWSWNYEVKKRHLPRNDNVNRWSFCMSKYTKQTIKLLNFGLFDVFVRQPFTSLIGKWHWQSKIYLNIYRKVVKMFDIYLAM